MNSKHFIVHFYNERLCKQQMLNMTTLKLPQTDWWVLLIRKRWFWQTSQVPFLGGLCVPVLADGTNMMIAACHLPSMRASAFQIIYCSIGKFPYICSTMMFSPILLYFVLSGACILKVKDYKAYFSVFKLQKLLFLEWMVMCRFLCPVLRSFLVLSKLYLPACWPLPVLFWLLWHQLLFIFIIFPKNYFEDIVQRRLSFSSSHLYLHWNFRSLCHELFRRPSR